MAKKKSTVGRKPLKPSERVVLVGFYIKQHIIDALGGKEAVRDISKNKVEQAYQGLNR